MNKKVWSIFPALCLLVVSALCALPSGAQMSDVKSKPPMYSYVANWQIPRARWAEMSKDASSERAILEKALADGTIVGYGNDVNLVHQADSETHDSWFSAMSMAGLMKVLTQFYASPDSTSSARASATKHWDEVFVSRYYNWKPGSWKDAYVSVSSYKLKADAPANAVDTLSKDVIVPVLEKLLTDGAIVEYDIDTQAVHTSAPGTFIIVYVAPQPDGLDKVDAAILDSMKTSPLSGPAFDSMIDSSAHRDELLQGNGTFK
ncbi:MAG: hypothetical protein KGM96_15045 [Acidobacteriota bacterium]|nr:hypothetical protein [Acidobacteriota bacterium]